MLERGRVFFLAGVGPEDVAGHGPQRFLSGAEQAIIADLLKAFGQNVLQEAMNEGEWRQLSELPFAGGGVLAAEHDVLVVNGNDSAVGDGDAEEIAGKVEQGLVAGADGFAVYDPVFVPDQGRDQVEQAGPLQVVAELGSEDGGDQFNPDQELFSCRPPLAAVRAQTAGRDQVMDMGVIAAGPVPGVEDAGHGDLAADKARVAGQGFDGGGRGFEQEVVDDFLV